MSGTLESESSSSVKDKLIAIIETEKRILDKFNGLKIQVDTEFRNMRDEFDDKLDWYGKSCDKDISEVSNYVKYLDNKIDYMERQQIINNSKTVNDSKTLNMEMKEDPLKRIQEEINEVARRERELREKQLAVENGTTNTTLNSSSDTIIDEPHKENGIVDDQSSGMSDDSGISSSSSPINGQSSNVAKIAKQYNRSNTAYPVVPPPPPMQLNLKLTRTMSTPQMFAPGMMRLNINSGQKGLMQRFIAAHGKISTNSALKAKDPVLTSIELNRTPVFVPPAELTPAIIERDEEGRPIRRGFVPVEEKIQKELRDLKNRETELKRLRRQSTLRQSQPDLLDCIEDTVEYDSSLESDDEEHCHQPAKLRASKSIGELCNELNNNSISPRDTPSPQFQRNNRTSGMRPAVSLAQLCDVEPDQAPSSHRLIAQWENLIQQSQEVS